MQDRPEAPDLLDAVAELLIKEILPLVQTHGDDLTAYKTLVSWNMLGVVARELRNGEELLNDELARLKNLPELAAFFAKSNAQPGDAGAVSYRAKLARVRECTQALADTIREKKIGPENKALWEHARQTVLEKLAVSNPRYSTND